MRRSRKLLSIGHSYVVALNRGLVHEMARVGAGTWEVTAVAPSYYHGDLRPMMLEPSHPELCRLVPVPAYLSRRTHLFFYGSRLRSLLRESWDLIHCWEEPYVVSGRQVAGWTGGRAPLVFTTFQNLAKRYPPPFNWLERGSMARAAGWIAAGHTVVETLRNRPGYRDRPFRIIPLGVDVELFRPDPTLGAALLRSLGWAVEGPPVLRFLGRFFLPH